MAQTSTATTTSAGTVEIKIAAAASYTNISGSTNSVDQVTIERVSGSKGTLDGDTQIIAAGRQVATMITVNCLYTEVTDEALKLTIASIKAGNNAIVMWKPVGSSGKSFTSASGGKITKVSLPEFNSENGEPAVFSFELMCGGVDTSFA